MFPGPILITGANGGIGCELVGYLVSNGVRNIACTYRSSNENILAVLKAYELNPEKHLFYAELTDQNTVRQLRSSIDDQLGPVWGLVNLAGGSTNALSWKMSKEEFQLVVDQNLLTTFLCCREFIPEMRKNKMGRIVNVSSVVAFTGAAGAAHYCAAKCGIIGLTKALSLELAPKDITVNALALGYFQYGLIDHLSGESQEQIKSTIPVKRFGKANEIGGLVQFLLSEDAAYTTGQVFHINGGLYS